MTKATENPKGEKKRTENFVWVNAVKQKCSINRKCLTPSRTHRIDMCHLRVFALYTERKHKSLWLKRFVQLIDYSNREIQTLLNSGEA